MANQLCFGERGYTNGPLKPGGEIRVGNQNVQATSKGEWIDDQVEVEIIGGTNHRVVVRQYEPDAPTVDHLGMPLPGHESQGAMPIEYPRSWIEQIHLESIGALLGMFAAIAIWLQGEPVSPFAIGLPIAGGFVGHAIRRLATYCGDFVGAYADPRPLVRGIAGLIFVGTLLGVSIGYAVGGNFFGATAGIFIGAFLAAATAFLVAAFFHT